MMTPVPISPPVLGQLGVPGTERRLSIRKSRFRCFILVFDPNCPALSSAKTEEISDLSLPVGRFTDAVLMSGPCSCERLGKRVNPSPEEDISIPSENPATIAHILLYRNGLLLEHAISASFRGMNLLLMLSTFSSKQSMRLLYMSKWTRKSRGVPPQGFRLQASSRGTDA
jgi:hypothetical protein